MKSIGRIILGIAIAGAALHAADWATRDCRLGPFVYDNCLWVTLRAQLGLPANRFLRMAVLEGVGIGLAAILYLTWQFVFPARRPAPPAADRVSTPQTRN